MKRIDTISEIWLEVSNIALNEGAPDAKGKTKVEIDVQLKGDNEDDRWLIFDGGVDKFKPLMEAMKDKRPIHAQLTPTKKAPFELEVTALRISFSATPARG